MGSSQAGAVSSPSQHDAWLKQASAAAFARRAKLENFPVASRFLSPTLRRDLAGVYAISRLIDEAGDAAPGDRLDLLDLLDGEIDLLADGSARYPAFDLLLPAVRERGLDPAPFHRLVQANRQDQSVSRYETFDDLRAYCRLSADPVGRLVLNLFGVLTPERMRLSDQICTALQIAEHLQDVGEDYLAGRVYVPQDSLARFEVSEVTIAGLADPITAPVVGGAERARVSGLLVAEARRARSLLRAGAPLVPLVPGRMRIAVAGFIGGGHAALDAVVAAGSSAVTTTPRPRPTRLLRHLTVSLLSGGRR